MASGLRYDQFFEQLQEYKEDFKRVYGREAKTMLEFEEYLKQKKVRATGRRNLTSLKGFDI